MIWEEFEHEWLLRIMPEALEAFPLLEGVSERKRELRPRYKVTQTEIWYHLCIHGLNCRPGNTCNQLQTLDPWHAVVFMSNLLHDRLTTQRWRMMTIGAAGLSPSNNCQGSFARVIMPDQSQASTQSECLHNIFAMAYMSWLHSGAKSFTLSSEALLKSSNALFL